MKASAIALCSETLSHDSTSNMTLFASLFGSRRTREILITDVTRMSGDRLCVAGIAGSDTIRLAEPSPTTSLVESLGGLDVGDVVRLEVHPLPRYRPPHREDCRWITRSLERVRHMDSVELAGRLRSRALPSLGKAFGSVKYFAPRGNPAYPPDRGKRSLATVPARDIRIYIHGEGLRADLATVTLTGRCFRWRVSQ